MRRIAKSRQTRWRNKIEERHKKKINKKCLDPKANTDKMQMSGITKETNRFVWFSRSPNSRNEHIIKYDWRLGKTRLNGSFSPPSELINVDRNSNQRLILTRSTFSLNMYNKIKWHILNQVPGVCSYTLRLLKTGSFCFSKYAAVVVYLIGLLHSLMHCARHL